MAGETQTESSVEQSTAAASVEVYQEQTPATVVSGESVSKVDAVVDRRQDILADDRVAEASGETVADETAEKVTVIDHHRVEEPEVETNDATKVIAAVPAEMEEKSKPPMEELAAPATDELAVAQQEETNPKPVEEQVASVLESARTEIAPDEHDDVVAPESEKVPNATNHVPELPKFLYDAVERLGREQGFTMGQMKIKFDAGSNKGDGFVGEILKAFISEGNRQEVYLCKLPPFNEARRKQFPAMAIFGRETLAYTKLLPIIFAYQQEKGVDREEGFFNVPKCYLAECNEAAEEAVIIMEDLRLDGYQMWNKLVPVNYAHARLAMEQLGRLHAVSFALKRDRPEVFEQFKVPDPLHVMMPKGGPFEEMMKVMIRNAMDTLQPQDTVERAKMQKLHDNFRTEMELCSNAAAAEPHAVLGHGDCWVNNYMFRYQKGTPEKIVLLDWQLTRYATPVLDIAYFIFCCTDEEFRQRHYDEMMGVYYHSLATLLEKMGHNPQEVFPRTALMRQLRRFGRFGILMAVFLVPMVCTRNEDLPDMDAAAEKYRDGAEVDLKPFTEHANKNAYQTRMRAVIRDVVRYGYL